jgi:carotenoid cleavage dioxygenase-like enzyme
VCCYPAPEPGQPVDLSASVVGVEGIGLTTIGGGLAVLEEWRIVGDRVERVQVDEQYVEYPRMDPLCEGDAFRYGYCIEMAWRDMPSRPESAAGSGGPHGSVSPSGLLKVDVQSNEMTAWSPGPWRTASEPIFVRASDGRSDDEGWLLTVVDDANRGSSDLYVLDASSMGRRRPEAVIHLPERLPLRSHGEWVPADRYR